MVLDQILRRAGFEVRTAANGSTCLELLDGTPDAVPERRRSRPAHWEPAGRERREDRAFNRSVFAWEGDQAPAVATDDFGRKPYRPHKAFDGLARPLGVRELRRTGSASGRLTADSARVSR